MEEANQPDIDNSNEAEEKELQPSNLKTTFINKFGYLRAGWRMMFYLIAIFLLQFPFKFLSDSIKPYLPKTDEMPSYGMLLSYVMLIITFILAGFVVLKWIDKRPFKTLGVSFTQGWLKEMSIGLGFGFGMLTLSFLILWLSGLLDVSAGSMDSVMLISLLKFLAMFIMVGIFEELMLRGYWFQAFIEGSGVWISAVILSVLFSVLHMFNPNWSAAGAFNIFLAGLLLSVAYIKTRSLWMPIGLHIAWNWTQGPLWGMNVSGLDIKNSFLVSLPQGPELLSGGEFGAEGSLIASFIIIFATWYIWKASWIKQSEENIEIWSKYPSGYNLPSSTAEE